MSLPSDPHASDPSLTPEERDLAQRLARLGGQREPAPALDARILAAAHDAVQISASASQQRCAHRPWPVTLGVAACLALAVGIAWRLRPLPDANIEYSQAPVAAQRATHGATTTESAAAANPADVAIAAEGASERPQRAINPPEPAKPTEQKRKAEPQRDASADAEADFVLEPAEPRIVFDDPSPVDMPAPELAPIALPRPPPSALPAPPPPPAPPASRAPSPSPAAASAGAAARSKHDEARQVRARGSLQREANAATEAEEASALDRVEVTGSRIGYGEDQPFDDQPPASADSPQVQQAWLQRIRELIARGELDDARASLREYQRRYPQQPLPDDLRALSE